MNNDRPATSLPQAIIFDCDGTLADTMPLHYQAWAETARRYDLELSEDRFYVLGGWPTRTMIELLARETGRSLDVDTIAMFKENAFLEMLDHVRPIEPVVAVARRIAASCRWRSPRAPRGRCLKKS